MFVEAAVIDEAGRICLPRKVLDALDVHAETEVLVELTDAGVVIRRKSDSSPITERLAQMNLPVADWDDMEREVETGHEGGCVSERAEENHLPHTAEPTEGGEPPFDLPAYHMGAPRVDINRRAVLDEVLEGA